MLTYSTYNKTFLDKNNLFIISPFPNTLICVFKALSFVNNSPFYIQYDFFLMIPMWDILQMLHFLQATHLKFSFFIQTNSIFDI